MHIVFLKWIEVADDEVDGLNILLCELLHVLLLLAVGKQTTMDDWVQRLDTPAYRDTREPM